MSALKLDEEMLNAACKCSSVSRAQGLLFQNVMTKKAPSQTQLLPSTAGTFCEEFLMALRFPGRLS
jgi:hypothetical protein